MRLAIRIREQNLDCYVFGSHKTPERFKRACTRFVHLENLKFDAHNAASHAKMKPLRPISDAKQIIRTSVTSLAVEPGSWVLLDHLKRELEHQRNDFDPRTYGHLRLRDLLIALGRPVIVDAPRDGEVRVRLITKKKKANPRVPDKAHMVLADAGLGDTDIELGTGEVVS
jgi:hypothetical protein